MLTEALKAVAVCFEKAGIAYMVIGGQAVLQYGEARFTQDIDLTVALTPDELDKIVNVLNSCGFSPIPDKMEEFVRDTWVLPVVQAGTKVRLDITFSIIPFERDAIGKAREVNIGGVTIKFISPEKLVVQKIIAGRPRDIEDVEGIINVQGSRLDREKIRYDLESLSREMGTTEFLDIWDSILSGEQKF